MVLSATQTQPSLRWSLYVCPYIASENPLRQSDSYHLNINSDTHNMLKSSILTNPASATSEAQAFAWASFVLRSRDPSRAPGRTFLLRFASQASLRAERESCHHKKIRLSALTDSRICIVQEIDKSTSFYS